MERKPVQNADAPDYPDNETYAKDRRKFLWMLGTGAVGVAGAAYVAAAAFGRAQPLSGTPAPPKPAGGIKPVALPPGVPPPPAGPHAPIGGIAPPPKNPTPAVPEAQLDERNRTIQPVQPEAALKGDVAAPVPPTPPVQPPAPLPGEAAAPVAPQPPKAVQPEAHRLGDVKAPVAPAVPEARLRGKPAVVQPPAVPLLRTRGEPPAATPENDK